jgi:hypothetical protein
MTSHMDDLTMDDLTMDDLSLWAICHYYARASRKRGRFARRGQVKGRASGVARLYGWPSSADVLV